MEVQESASALVQALLASAFFWTAVGLVVGWWFLPEPGWARSLKGKVVALVTRKAS